MSKIKQVWKIYFYETRFQRVIFTSAYTLKSKLDHTNDSMNKKIRKDFAKLLKNKSTKFDFERIK